MAASLFSIIVWLELVLAAYGLGRPLVRGLGLGGDCRLVERLTLGLAFGMVIGGTFFGAVGICGRLYWPLVAAITLIASFAGLAQLLFDCGPLVDRRLSAERPPSWRAAPEAHRGASFEAWAVLTLLVGLAAGGSFLAALAPPTAGDALCYHLELPKIFLQRHAVCFLPFHETSTYPLLAEMWYAWAMVVGDPVTAQLVHWLMGLLLAAATYLLAALLLPEAWARWAGLLVLLVPGITNQMSAPLNDVAVAAFTTLALAVWLRADRRADYRHNAACGLLLGGALATKYHALLWLAAVAVVVVVQCLRKRSGAELRRLAVRAVSVGVVAVSVCGMWYLRAAVYRGNPVYPFFSRAASDAGVPEPLRSSKRPLGWRPAEVVTLPWRLTMSPAEFGGRGHRLGALLLLMVGPALVARRLHRLRFLLAISAVYTLGWYATRQNLRFLHPIVPLLLVGCAWWWSEMRRFPRAAYRCATAFAFCGLLPAALAPAWRGWRSLPVALGLETREEYLLRHEPTYPAATVANCLTGGEGRVLSQDYRAFYFDCEVVREAALRRATRYDRSARDPSRLTTQLKAWDFDYVLVAENVGERGIRYNATLKRMIDRAWAENPQAFERLLKYRFADADGAVREYQLIKVR